MQGSRFLFLFFLLLFLYKSKELVCVVSYVLMLFLLLMFSLMEQNAPVVNAQTGIKNDALMSIYNQ